MCDRPILYDKPECPFCWRVRMALHRCGIEVERRDHQTYEAQWRGLTDTGTVPVLQFEDLLMVDSSIMLEYLNERCGGLWPATPAAAARARSIALLADRTLGAAVRDLVFECRDKNPDEWDRSVIEGAVQRWCAAMPEMEHALHGGEFYVDQAGITDYVIATRFGLGMAYGMPEPGSRAMKQWFQRMLGRAEFQATAPPRVTDAIQRGWQR